MSKLFEATHKIEKSSNEYSTYQYDPTLGTYTENKHSYKGRDKNTVSQAMNSWIQGNSELGISQKLRRAYGLNSNLTNQIGGIYKSATAAETKSDMDTQFLSDDINDRLSGKKESDSPQNQLFLTTRMFNGGEVDVAKANPFNMHFWQNGNSLGGKWDNNRTKIAEDNSWEAIRENATNIFLDNIRSKQSKDNGVWSPMLEEGKQQLLRATDKETFGIIANRFGEKYSKLAKQAPVYGSPLLKAAEKDLGYYHLFNAATQGALINAASGERVAMGTPSLTNIVQSLKDKEAVIYKVHPKTGGGLAGYGLQDKDGNTFIAPSQNQEDIQQASFIGGTMLNDNANQQGYYYDVTTGLMKPYSEYK
jgi:hypothetical protein